MKKEKTKDPKKRKKLLILPLLVIPFLTMAFWALGGGGADTSRGQKKSVGLNLQLPGAQLKDDKDENKLSYYEQAERDSARWRQGMQNDPFFPSALNDSVPGKSLAYDPSPSAPRNYSDPNEQKVYQKLAELNSHLENSNNSGNAQKEHLRSGPPPIGSSFKEEEVDRLEEVMKNVSSSSTKDPEVDQLNKMMDRILDIQHPERVKQRLREVSSQSNNQVCDVRNKNFHYTISLLDTGKNSDPANAFYGLGKEAQSDQENATPAEVHGNQNLVQGSIVKIRLLGDITVDDQIIPVGSFVFGTAALDGERLHIEITSIRKANSLYPVRLTVYDLDGMEGIFIPGAISRDVAKESAGGSLQSIEMSSIDPSLKAQAAAAGISAAKTLLQKKVKLVKVTVKAGYRILLKQSKIS